MGRKSQKRGTYVHVKLIVHPKGDQSWVFIGRTDVEAESPILWPPDVQKLTHLKRPWCWERFKAGEEGDNRGWDGWMASLTQWTWVCINSRSWWWTGRLGVLQSMGSQRVGHDWMTTELKWTMPSALLGLQLTNCSSLALSASIISSQFFIINLLLSMYQ